MTAKISSAAVEKLVNAAIASDLSNEKIVKEALANAVLLAAIEGRFDQLNNLYRGVSVSTMEGIRLYMVNLGEDTGTKVHDAETDRTRIITFWTFQKKIGFDFVSKDKRGDAYKEHRDHVSGMTVKQLMDIPLGARSRATVENATEFSFAQFETRMGSLLKKAVSEGAINNAQFEQFNKLLSAGNRVNLQEVADARDKRIEAARKLLEKEGLAVVPNEPEPKEVKQAKAA